MRDDPADVGLRVLGNEVSAAALPAGGEQRGLVPADRGNAVERVAIAAEANGIGGEVVFVLDLQHLLEPRTVDEIQNSAALRAARLDGKAWNELPIGENTGELLIVFEQQFALRGVDVDAIEIMPGFVAVVDGDDQRLRKIEAQLLNAGIDPGKRRQIARRAAVD